MLVALSFFLGISSLGSIQKWCFAEQSTGGNTNAPFVLSRVTDFKPLPDGIEVRADKAVLRIIAVTDDILRIRIGNEGKLPEDASWAVLSGPRSQEAIVTKLDDSKFIGFQTKSLCLRIERDSLRLVVSDLSGKVLHEDAAGWPIEFHGSSFRLYKQMPPDEHYFGLGDKIGPLDRRNQAFTDWNTDSYRFQESTDPLYKSIPFILTLRRGMAMGMLFDNTWRNSFDFGKEHAGIYSFGAEGGPIDYYLIYGPEPKQVLEKYAWLTGTPPLPPLWSLGYQQSRYSYETESQLRAIAAKLRADKIPADALYLDIDFQQKNRPFTVDKTKFPHFPEMLSDLAKDHFHVVAITDLHIARVAKEGYVPYDSGVAGDHFVKNPDGSTFVGKVWPGPSVFPDFTQQSTRQWWGNLYKEFVAEGVSGFWNDMNEPSVFNTPNFTMPEGVQHRIDESGFQQRVASHLEIHNVYGMENSRATFEGLLKLDPNKRPFVLTRATYAGGQRFAATWTGDNSSTWNHLRLTTPMLLNLGLSGFGLAGADVGGFVGSSTADLLTKWIELGAFQPIDRDHTEKGSALQEPWVNGPAQEDIRRRYIEERYRLMPYLYTTVEEMSRTGIPVMRPLFLEFPKANADGHPLDLDGGNEYLFGPSLLVAPAPYPERPDSYEVLLPSVRWYDYWTGLPVETQPRPAAVADGGASASGSEVTEVVVRPSLETLPVYVREGAILPMQPLVQSTGEIPHGPLTLRVYPGKDCSGSLYQDDGQTLNYKHGDFLRMNFSCEVLPGSIKVRIGPHDGNYQSWWKELRVEIYGWSGSSVAVKSKNGSQSGTVDPSRHMAAADIQDDGRGDEVEFKHSL